MKLRVNTGPLSNAFQQKNYISWLIYGLSTLLIVLLQMAPRMIPAIFYFRPLPIVVFVICVAVLGGARTGVTVGVLAGLFCGMFSTHIFGFDVLMLMLFGLIAGLLVEWLLRANLYSALLLSFVGLLIYCLAEWLFGYVLKGYEDLSSILFRVILPCGGYTVLLTPLVYWFALAITRFVRRRLNG